MSGNPAGRPPGIVSRITAEMREYAERFLTDENYRRGLEARINAGQAPHIETLLWQYLYGKPKDVIKLEGEERRRPLMIVFGQGDPLAEPEPIPEGRHLPAPPLAQIPEVSFDLEDLDHEPSAGRSH